MAGITFTGCVLRRSFARSSRRLVLLVTARPDFTKNPPSREAGSKGLLVQWPSECIMCPKQGSES